MAQLQYHFIEKWQGRVTVEIEDKRYQFATVRAWEEYKNLRSGIYPYTHAEAASFFEADEITELQGAH